MVLALCVGAAMLCTSCMDTRSASLGIEAERSANLAPDAGRRDAGVSVADGGRPPERVDAVDGQVEHDTIDHADGDQRDDHLDRDDGAGDVAIVDGGKGPPDAGHSWAALDAGSVPATVDARVSDASVARHDDERDSAREDARAAVNPLCIAEPWHCQ